MKKRRTWWMLALCLVLVLSACGSPSSAPANEEEQSNESEGGSEESQEIKRGGIHTIAISGDPQSLDPHISASYLTHTLIGLSYSKLVTYKTGPDVAYTDYIIVPDLAEDWDISEDGLVYTFYLRKDAKWHNIPPVNGRNVVADDVIATMERIQKLPGHQAYMLEMVEKIEAPDDHTVVFTLKEPFAPFLNYMANQFMWIIPREGAEGQYDLNTTVIGTGPFIMEKWNKGVETIYKKNPDYFIEDRPYLDGVKVLTLTDQSTRVAAFRTEQLDSLSSVGASQEDVQNILRSKPETQLRQELSNTHVVIFINQNRKPFDDLRVRKAIAYAVDKQGMVDTIYGEGGEISSPVAPILGKWALPLEERESYLKYDPEEAKRLLAEAGFPNGFKTTITVTPGYGESVIRAAQWVAEDLKQIGIEADIEVVEYSTYVSQTWPKAQHDMIVGLQTPFLEADEWLLSQHHSQGTRNWFGINDPELDQMLVEQRRMLDEDQRLEKVHEIQRYILENVMNPIPLAAYPGFTMLQPYVKNYYPQSSYGLLHMKELWLDK